MENLQEIKRLQKLAGIKNQQLNEGWKDLALGAMMTGASMLPGQKAQAQTQDKAQTVQSQESSNFSTYKKDLIKNPIEFQKQLGSNKAFALDYMASYSENPEENQKALMKAKIEYVLGKQPLEYVVKDSSGKQIETRTIKSIQEYEDFTKEIRDKNKAGAKLTALSNLADISDDGLEALKDVISSTIRGSI